MPFGLQEAPAMFQSLMDQLLKGLGDFSAAYIEDVVNHSSTWKEHVDHLQQVLDCLQKVGITAKPKKCQCI